MITYTVISIRIWACGASPTSLLCSKGPGQVYGVTGKLQYLNFCVIFKPMKLNVSNAISNACAGFKNQREICCNSCELLPGRV